MNLPLDDTLKSQDSFSNFPIYGVRLSYLLRFFEEHNRHGELIGKTTSQVCEEVVKPITEQRKCSMCSLLMDEKTLREEMTVGVATVFISHAWSYVFSEMLEALRDHFTTPATTENVVGDEDEVTELSEQDPILWLDVFSINQHEEQKEQEESASSEGGGFEWWSTTFKNAIGLIHHTVIVLSPWDNPAPLTRAWCIWELYSTIEMNCRFEVALSQTQKTKFIEDMVSMTNLPELKVEKMLSLVNSEKSEARDASDVASIHEAIRRSVGFLRINALINERMRDWVIETVRIDMEQTNDNEKRTLLRYSLGSLLSGQGKFSEAEACYRDCLPTVTDDETKYVILSSLAGVLKALGRYTEAEGFQREYLSYLQGWRDRGAEEDQRGILIAKAGLASFCESNGKYEEAIKLYHEVLQGIRDEESEASLMIQRNAIDFFLSIGLLEEAEPICRHCIAMSKKVLGENHPQTAFAMNSQGLLYLHMKRFPEAEAVLTESCAKVASMQGEENADHVAIYGNLAMALLKQKKYAEAEGYLEKNFTRSITLYGESDEATLTTMINLAEVKGYLQKDDEALDLYTRAYEIGNASLGKHHVIVLRLLGHLGMFHMKRQHLEIAKEYFTGQYENALQALGKDNPLTVNAIKNLISIHLSVGNHAEVRALALLLKR